MSSAATFRPFYFMYVPEEDIFSTPDCDHVQPAMLYVILFFKTIIQKTT